MSKYACVTGADRGVGFELVRQLLIKDYTVFAGSVLTDWNLLAGIKEQYKDRLYVLKMDISEDESVKEAKEFIFSKTDTINVLINNGAILGDINATVFDNIDFDEINRVFNVNSVGSLRVSNALISLVMNSEDKLIVNISSEAGSVSNCWRSSWFAYGMSKAALNMCSAIVHNSIKDLGGQVLVIHPGHVKTYMQGKLDTAGVLTPEESATYILERIFNHKKYLSEKPSYIDYLGNRMEW